MREIKNTAIICLSPYYGGMEMDAIGITDLLSSTASVTFIVKYGAQIAVNYDGASTSRNVRLETIKFHRNFSFSIIRQVRDIVKKNKIQNVIFFGASELRSLYFSFLWLNINLIVRHGTTKSTPKKDLPHKLIYSDVNYHVALCEHLAANVEYIIPFRKNTELKIIYPSLRHNPSNIRKGELVANRKINLLHVGRIAEGKGQISAIEACAALYEQNICFSLTLVGEIETSYEAKLKSALSNIQYRDSIYVHAFTTDIFRYYREADIFLFPSKGEGFGNVFIEALSYGLVCVAFDNTSFPGFKQMGFDMFLAKDNDLGSLKHELMNACNFVQNHCIPSRDNISLATSIYSKERELSQFVELLV